MSISLSRQTADFFLVEAESALRKAAMVFDDRNLFDELIKKHNILLLRVEMEVRTMAKEEQKHC
jgi:ABC-type polar amino acid transport system ATPase subunit